MPCSSSSCGRWLWPKMTTSAGARFSSATTSALPRAMARLAREEAGHLGQVLSLMEKRGLSLGRDPGDPYAQGLQSHVRQPARERLLDRLLISALIESRSEERLRLLGEHL